MGEKKSRPEVLHGVTRRMSTGCGKLYVTMNFTEDGKPFEIFAKLGKAGGCPSSQTEALGRLISLLLRSDCDYEQLIITLKGISCHHVYGLGDDKVWSCADAIATVMRAIMGNPPLPTHIEPLVPMPANGHKPKFDEEANASNEIGACPECGAPVVRIEGCMACSAHCGWTRCG